MTCIDRYILFVYLRTLLVCFVSIAGVFVVFHAFTNMDDLAEHAERTGGMVAAFVGFYGPFMLMLFEMTGTIIALLALIFTIGLLRRSGELTAILSAGISHGRIVRPMLIAAGGVIGFAALNRELLLPRWQDQLGMKARDLAGDTEQPLLPCYDTMAGVLIKGKSLVVLRKEIVAPAFKIHPLLPEFGQQLNADVAHWIEAKEGRPSGYLLSGVSSPQDIDSLPSQSLANQTALRTALDTPWLAPGQCFVASRVEYDFLQNGTSWKRLATTADLVRRVSNPAVYCAADVHVTLHDRWLRPPLDFSLIVLSLSLVVGRTERNLFVVAGYATGLVGLFFGLRTGFHMMGGSDLVDPATAAWAPLLVLGPLAYARYRIVQVS